jgi:hypothetical protein
MPDASGFDGAADGAVDGTLDAGGGVDDAAGVGLGVGDAHEARRTVPASSGVSLCPMIASSADIPRGRLRTDPW